MSSTLAELEKKAIELSPEDRARFALSLIQSLESAEEGDIEEAWRMNIAVPATGVIENKAI